MIKINKCPLCDSKKIKLVTENVKKHLGKETVIIPNIQFYKCFNCHESFYPPEAMDKFDSFRHKNNKVKKAA